MRISFALAAAMLLVTVSAPAATSGPSPTVHPSIRLKGSRPVLKPIQAIFQGDFINGFGKHYQVQGTGNFVPVEIGDKTGYRYTANLIATPTQYPYAKLDFGTFDGQGPVNSSNPPGQLEFQILGTPNVNGYRLNVTGQITDGFMMGTFSISGDDGSGQGDLGGG